MRHPLHDVLLSSLIAILLVSCQDTPSVRHGLNLADLQEWVRPEYVLDDETIGHEMSSLERAFPPKMYADNYTRAHYRQGGGMVWLSRTGLAAEADSLLPWLEEADELGFSRSFFHTDTLHSMLRQMRDYDLAQEGASRIGGRLEFLLTQAYLRYVCGQRFGYIHPRQVFNHLLEDTPAAGETQTTTVYRRLYDQGADEVTDSFIHHALDAVRHHGMNRFLRDIQPTDSLYRQLLTEYRHAQTRSDTARTRLARINMERARWRYPRPEARGKYVFVNLAGQELTAYDADRDSLFTMRVCCGNASHKTPLLHSQIGRVELNPYWVIPQSIVRKEIMPRHVGDSAYYARNRYRAIHKETRQEVNPASLSAAQLRSGQYTLRQDNGAGNSLGRIIFRFPNNFSVFLHDTNNRGAFQYANRAISHGCVRVERPLDLALFMLDAPGELFVDRIRMAIDLPPISQQGLRYQEAHPDARPLGNFTPTAPVPVWLDYWTLFPDPHGQLHTHPDRYGYDHVLEKILNTY